jgi:glucose/mannose transport system permease protein
MTGQALAGERSGVSAFQRVQLWLQRVVPVLVISPSLVISLVFVYCFMAITGYLSFTNSRLLPDYRFDGLGRYRQLFANDVWWTSVVKLVEFTVPYVGISLILGLVLALLMDQRIKMEGLIRAIYLYPLALSQIVAGIAWQWMLNPSYGLESVVKSLGWTDFHFDWLGSSQLAIYCIAIAAIWQSSGFVAALFLAGLRGVDDEIVKAAQVDGASMPRIYYRVVLPVLRPVFVSVLLILCHLSIKTFDLIVAMTDGGPGNSTWLPSIFMYNFAFARGRMGIGAASSMMMLAMVVAVLIPMMYLESRTNRDAA